MAGIKSLAKDTAIYGMSSIIGKFLNWCLTPLYTYLLVPAEYGIVVYLYAWIGTMLVLLTYGLRLVFSGMLTTLLKEIPKPYTPLV